MKAGGFTTTSAICGRRICFQKFGLDGLDTDISRDDDHYLASKLKEIGFPTWSDPATAPCHSLMPATQRRVMQYPPGTGFALALFPAGFQVIPLYVLATVVVFGFVLLAISLARTGPALLLAAAFGGLALYLMINPDQGELFDGADDGDLRRSRPFSRPRLFAARAAAKSVCSVGAGRISDRSGRQFQIAEPVSLLRIFRIFLRFIFNIPQNRDGRSGCCCSEPHFWRGWRRRCSRTRSMPAAPSRPPTERRYRAA